MYMVLCEYEKVETHSIMKLTSSSYGVSCFVDTELVPQLSKLNWCLDTTKGEIYAHDSSMEIPKKLGVSSPRVYLWKYVTFLSTGNVVKAWRGRNQYDYRYKVGGLIHGWHVIETLV